MTIYTKSEAEKVAEETRQLLMHPEQWKVIPRQDPNGYVPRVVGKDMPVVIIVLDLLGAVRYRAIMNLGETEPESHQQWQLSFSSGKRRFQHPQTAVNALFTGAESRLMKIMSEYRRSRNLAYEGRERI